MITSEWPTERNPEFVPFLVNEINQLRKCDVDITVFAFSGQGKIVNYLKAWVGLRRKFNINDYDLIHAQWGQSALLALPKKIPLVVTFRGSDLIGIVNENGKYAFSGNILRIISQFTAKIADKVIIVSESLKDYLPDVSYDIVSVCLDTEIFQPIEKKVARAALGMSLDEKLVLFPANPQRPEKRFQLAKEAVGLLGDNVKIIVAKNVNHKEMPLYYNACDVMVITSSHEGSPTVVYEALACNLPIVSLNVGNVRQIIERIDGCYICEEDTPTAIANHLEIVLDKKNRIEGFSKIQQFTTKSFCEKMINIYKKCVQES